MKKNVDTSPDAITQSPPEMIVEPNDPPIGGASSASQEMTGDASVASAEKELKALMPPGTAIRVKKIDDYFDVAISLPLSKVDEIKHMQKVKEVVVDGVSYRISPSGENRYKLTK